jgi:hypothetical protein
VTLLLGGGSGEGAGEAVGHSTASLGFVLEFSRTLAHAMEHNLPAADSEQVSPEMTTPYFDQLSKLVVEIGGRWVIACLLATAALWVQIQTSLAHQENMKKKK